MDNEQFDRFVRLLGRPGTRRAALGALLGAGTIGAFEGALGKAKGKHRKGGGNHRDKNRDKRRERENRSQAQPQAPDPAEGVAIEATCGSPGPSSNLNGCNFSGDDLDGFDLSSSNMKNANFNGASLCGADLSSSTLTNADFRNANLTRADLHSSGCNGIKTNAATVFCQTITCTGTVRNDDCPGAAPGTVCCAAANCPERVCQTASCSDNRCAYANQPDGRPGIQCPADRQCCTGQCCANGQKCCGGTCIADDRCCAGGTPDACPDNEECCGGTCVPNSICCTDGQQGCPSAECCGGGTCQASDRWEQCRGDGQSCGQCPEGEVCAGAQGCQTCASQPGVSWCEDTANPANREKHQCGVFAGDFKCACLARIGSAGGFCAEDAVHCNIFNPNPVCASDADCVALGWEVCVEFGNCLGCPAGVACARACGQR